MDLKTIYMGLELKNPIVPSASPLTRRVANIRKLEDAGAAAVVMHSLFEEQITGESEQLDHYLSYGSDSFAEALSYYPDMESYTIGPDRYLDIIRRAKDAVNIPIIGSLNGVSTGGWVEYAKKIEEAGANALELNTYYIPTDVSLSSAEIEQMYIDVVKEVKGNVSFPVAVKLSPFFSATGNMAHRLVEVGADALVLFNRFYQPDFDLEELEVVPNLTLSQSNELRLPLCWVAILYGRVAADFAVTSGVHTHIDVLKSLMAGAKVAMTTSSLLKNGIGHIADMLKALTFWMEEREYESVTQMQGSMSQQNVADPAAFERANYMRVLQSWRADPASQVI